VLGRKGCFSFPGGHGVFAVFKLGRDCCACLQRFTVGGMLGFHFGADVLAEAFDPLLDHALLGYVGVVRLLDQPLLQIRIAVAGQVAGAGTAKTPALQGPANGGFVLPEQESGYFESNEGEGLTVTTGAGCTTAILIQLRDREADEMILLLVAGVGMGAGGDAGAQTAQLPTTGAGQ
jgi:hypothetical protein